jgi:uncharacterized membrane protein YgdD (TMEM256/DUF423 family)
MQQTSRIFLISACLLLLTGVQLGALGAHALDNVLTPKQLNSWELAVQYQLVHSLGLIAISLLQIKFGAVKLMDWAGILMLLGIFLFSGSIYMSALGFSIAAPIAPYGGGSFMLAWLLLAIAIYRNQS